MLKHLTEMVLGVSTSSFDLSQNIAVFMADKQIGTAYAFYKLQA